jgi:hypothetical protein
MSGRSTFPSLEKMCLEVPLYQRVEIDEERIEDFREKILKDGEFDN